jgi:hypothetical protein
MSWGRIPVNMDRTLKITYCMMAKRKKIVWELGVEYGLSGEKIGETVSHPYIIRKNTIDKAWSVKTVTLILNRKTRRPAKKRRIEICSRDDNASITKGIWNVAVPLAKNARVRACFSGLYPDGRVTATYRRAHCCDIVANRAVMRLTTKLRNQSEFTQMALLEGENGTTVEGTDARVAFGSARTW